MTGKLHIVVTSGVKTNLFVLLGHEVVAEKDVKSLRFRSTIFYSVCAFWLLLSTHDRRTMEQGKRSNYQALKSRNYLFVKSFKLFRFTLLRIINIIKQSMVAYLKKLYPQCV